MCYLRDIRWYDLISNKNETKKKLRRYFAWNEIKFVSFFSYLLLYKPMGHLSGETTTKTPSFREKYLHQVFVGN